MKDTILEKLLDAKLLTAAGGILLAAYLSFVLFKVLTNDLTHLNTSIDKQADIQANTNVVLEKLAGATESNTQVLKELKEEIRRK